MSDVLARVDYTLDALEALDGRVPHPVDTAVDSNDRDGWQVRDLDSATYASRKAAKAARDIEQIDAWEERQIELIRAAADTERARERATLEFFEGALAQYLAQLIRDGRKVKTLDLPYGRIAIRRRQPKVELDEDRALAWARDNAPDALRVRESIDKTRFRKCVHLTEGGHVVSDDGEVLEFATWTEQADAGKFTPAKGDTSELEEPSAPQADD